MNWGHELASDKAEEHARREVVFPDAVAELKVLREGL